MSKTHRADDKSLVIKKQTKQPLTLKGSKFKANCFGVKIVGNKELPCRRKANQRRLIAGREVKFCRECAQNWDQVYDETLARIQEAA